MNIQKKVFNIRNKEKVTEILKDIDFSPLNEKVSSIVDIPINFKIDVSNRGDISIYDETDIKEKTGFLVNSLEKVLIKDFGVNINEICEYDKDLYDAYIDRYDWDGLKTVPFVKVDEYISINLDARIYLKNGGENGIHILTAFYNIIKKEWSFK